MGTDSLYMDTTLTPEDIIARYNEKLKLYCDNIDPYSLDVSECSEAIADLPNITTHQIYSYLMLSKCPYSGKNAERSLDYQNSTQTGQVTKIYIKNFDDITIVLGEILIPETGEYFNPWFVSFPYGYVLCAHCSCVNGTNEMCIHIGGLLHKVQTLKTHINNTTEPPTPCDEAKTDETSANARVSNSEPIENGGQQLRKCHRMKRKKRVKMYVCGICMSQFSDKVTFMDHCQQNHTLPEFLSSNNHKRRRIRHTNATIDERSDNYPLVASGVTMSRDSREDETEENEVTLAADGNQLRDQIGFDNNKTPGNELEPDIIDLDNFIGADEMSVDEFLMSQQPYEILEIGTMDEYDDNRSPADEDGDIISAMSDRTPISVCETQLLRQEPDLIIIDDDLEALEKCM